MTAPSTARVLRFVGRAGTPAQRRRLTGRISALASVLRAVVLDGSDRSIQDLRRWGLAMDGDLGQVDPRDLLVFVELDDPSPLPLIERMLGDDTEETVVDDGEDVLRLLQRPAALDAGYVAQGQPNLAVVGIPSPYCLREARRALDLGMHVVLPGDAVSLDEEAELKARARERGQIVLGPDGGMGIIDGCPIGIANVIRPGAAGIVSASGTAAQEVASLLHTWGGGVSQVLGTGGRDLSLRVGGRATLSSIPLVAGDPRTEVLVVLSKPPAGTVSHNVLSLLRDIKQPVIVCFLDGETRPRARGVVWASCLEDAAIRAAQVLGLTIPDAKEPPATKVRQLTAWQRDLVGLFAGGGLAYEALSLARQRLEVRSNVRLLEVGPLEGSGHRIVDLGDPAQLAGRAHPLVDPKTQVDAIVSAGHDPAVAIILFDCVIGYGASADVAESLADAFREALAAATARGGGLLGFASVTGVTEDPQNAERVAHVLAEAGVEVARSNALATRWALAAVQHVAQREQLVERDAPTRPLLGKPVRALGVGEPSFVDGARESNALADHVRWEKPAGGDEHLANLLEKLR